MVLQSPVRVEDRGAHRVPNANLKTRVRLPDICVVRKGKPVERVRVTAPLLCVEILSPEDRTGRVMKRLDDFVAMGAENLWILDPSDRGRGWRNTSPCTRRAGRITTRGASGSVGCVEQALPGHKNVGTYGSGNPVMQTTVRSASCGGLCWDPRFEAQRTPSRMTRLVLPSSGAFRLSAMSTRLEPSGESAQI